MRYLVPGMHCAHCVAAVEEEVSAVPGVESVDGRPRDEARRRGGRAAGRRGDPRRDRGSGVRGSLMAVATPETETLRLDVEGMTCASCAARIERKLNKLDGVEATVNYATEAASVSFDPASVSVDDLIATVEATGYHAALPSDVAETPDAGPGGADAARRRGAADGAARRDHDGAAVPVRRLGVGRARARDTRRVLGRRRVPSRDAPERPPRRRDDGHADLGRHARRLDVVDGRPRRRHRRAHLLRGRRRDHDADPARPLARAPRARPLGRGDPRPARARREGGPRAPRAARRCSSPSSSSRSATCSSSGRARRSRPTASSWRARPRSTSRC